MTILARGDLTLDTETGMATAKDGQSVRLTRTETRVIALLMRTPELCSRERIMDAIWDGRTDGPQEKIADVLVSHLRRKLRPIGAGDFIATDWGRGYRILAPVPSPATVLTLDEAQKFALRAVLRAARRTVPQYVEIVEACL